MDEQRNHQKSDEIDLIEVFNSLGRGIKNLFNGIFQLISKLFQKIVFFTFRNYIALIITIAITIGLYFFEFSQSAPVYDSFMKIKANAITTEEAISYLSRLKPLTKNNSIKLSETLNIDTVQSSKLLDVTAAWYIDLDGDGTHDYCDFDNEYVKAKDDTISQKIKEYFQIRISYKKGFDVNVINDKIVYYFNQNPYFVKENEMRKEQLNKLYSLALLERSKLDTIRNRYNTALLEKEIKPETKNGQLVFLDGNPAEDLKEIKLFHNDIFSLENRAQRYNRDLKVHPDIVTVLEPFSQSTKPTEVIKDLKKYSILFFIVAILALILFENRKKLIELKKQSKLSN